MDGEKLLVSYGFLLGKTEGERGRRVKKKESKWQSNK